MARSSRQDRRLSGTQLLLIIAVALAVAFVVDFGRLILMTYDLDQQAAAARQDMTQLDAEYRDLQTRLDYVRSPDYVREVAPVMLLMSEPGARILVPTDKPVPATPPAKTP